MWVIVAACTVTLNGCAGRQPTPAPDSSPTPRPDSRSEVDTQRLASLIDKALPKWTEDVLTVPDGKD